MEWYVGTEWRCERKGLHKRVLDLKFQTLQKPHKVAKVTIEVSQVEHLAARPSTYLNQIVLDQEQQLQLGTALTPVDCYVEELVQQMLVGEKSQCTIRTKGGDEIGFVLTLKKIHESREIHTLSVAEMYALAEHYKKQGVAMFMKHPTFAHHYFTRAAKCLLSYEPLDPLSEAQDGVAGAEMQALLKQIQTNLAACLLAEHRYEDVIYQTQFVEDWEGAGQEVGQECPTVVAEKAIYRRAMAFFHMKEFDKAQCTVEKVLNWQERKEFVKLVERIAADRKTSDAQYKHLVQRMFS